MNKSTIIALTSVSVAEALKNAFEEQVKPQIQSIMNDVVMPVICVVLLIAFVVRGIFIWKDFRQGNEIHWGSLLVLFICLVISVSASLWMWGIIGW